MKRRIALLRALAIQAFCCALIFCVSLAGAKPPKTIDSVVKDVMDDEYSMAKDWTAPAYMGVVLETSDVGTRGNPPSSKVMIVQTLRGAEIKNAVRVIWTNGKGIVSSTDYIDPACTSEPRFVCRFAMHEESMAESIAPPALGAKFIFATMAPETLESRANYADAIPGVYERIKQEKAVAAYGVYPASPANLTTFSRTALFEEPYSERFSGTLFSLIIFASMISLMAAFFRLPIVGLGCGAATFLFYAWYETGIGSNVNIRIDLVLLLPVFAVALIGMGISLARLDKPRDASNKAKHSIEKNE